jgi:hypothetical protein
VAVVLVRHLNKDGSLRSMYRGGGSIAFSAAARSVLVTERHPDDDDVVVLARVKGNVAARDVPSLAYRLVVDPAHDVPKIEWEGPTNLTAEDLFAGFDSRREAPARQEAEQFLRELLGDGPKDFREVEKAAKAAGLSMRTVRKAKAKLKVKSRQARKGQAIGKWVWYLPGWTEDLEGGNTRVHYDLT